MQTLRLFTSLLTGYKDAMFIFLDESGDLGFDFSKTGTSRYFTITILVCHSQQTMKAFQVAAKRAIRKKLNPKRSAKKQLELKGTGTSLAVKRYFLKHAPASGWGIYSVTLNKARAYDHLKTKNGKKKLYNYLARFLIDRLPIEGEDIAHVNLVVDRCKNKAEIKDFNSYIENQLDARLSLKTMLHISHDNSQQNLCLQAVDLFCWGISRQRTCDDAEWFKEFSDKVRMNELYLP